MTALNLLAFTLPDLTGIYLFAAVVGGGFLLITTLIGALGDADVGADADAHLDLPSDVDADWGHVDLHADADADVHDFHLDHAGMDGHGFEGHDSLGDQGSIGHEGAIGHHGPVDSAFHISQWISLRFVIYFLAGFGLVGILLTWFSGTSPTARFCWAMGTGLVMGRLAHNIRRILQRREVNSEPIAEDFLNQPARVTVTIRPHHPGEIAVRVRGTERFLPAGERNHRQVYNPGDVVFVVQYNAGVAEVVSREEFEFLNEKREDH